LNKILIYPEEKSKSRNKGEKGEINGIYKYCFKKSSKKKLVVRTRFFSNYKMKHSDP